MLINIAKAPDFLALARQFPARYPALFESAAPQLDGKAIGRYDVLAISNGEQLIGDLNSNINFFDALAIWLKELSQPESVQISLPFRGGWVVFLSYESARWIEPKLASAPASAAPVLPVALALRAPAALVLDRKHNQVFLVCEPGFEALARQCEQDCAQISLSLNQRHMAELPCDIKVTVHADPGAPFLESVQRIHAYLRAGDVFQVNLSRDWRADSTAPIVPTDLYKRLRKANPAPFAALLQYGNAALLSSSPERLVQVQNGLAQTRPIAGTRARAQTKHEDDQLKANLVGDPKERAEHIMLIDLERNDLGRVCQPGSVEVDELLGVESYTHVHHIVSNVRGKLRAGVGPVEVLKALFPGGTITGCPKVRCMEIIAELEATPRGAYTGAIGFINRNGDMDFNILIRSIEMQNYGGGAHLSFRAGAGIVADSIAEKELAETEAKAKGLLRALESN
jgi:anthranilate synthase component I